jgi:hydrogenase expression/formation protein HypD
LAVGDAVMLCSYGDMLRVPGEDPEASVRDLLAARAIGADVRVITAPQQALALACRHPERQVVLLAVGFETTAPATALLVEQACRQGVTNLSLLTALVRVVPAMSAVAAAPGNPVQGFLAAGHVAAVMGGSELERFAEQMAMPVVITGFEPLELLTGLLACVEALERGSAGLVNAYARVVRSAGNPAARALVERVFAVADGEWRGFGRVADGLQVLRPAYHHLDARLRFGLPAEPAALDGQELVDAATEMACISAAVLQGRSRPPDCPSFGTACTPQHPLGAPMVSSEGACAAYYAYRR